MPLTLQYVRASTPMHRMDALSKFLWIVLLGILGFIVGDPLFLGILIALLVLVTFSMAHVPLRVVRASVTWLILLAVLAGAFQTLLWRSDPHVLFAVGPYRLTGAGLRVGLLITFRITLIAYASLIFVWTTDPRAIIMALIYMRIPYRIAYSVFVALRFVPLLENEASVIREAQLVRGVEQVAGRVEALKRYALPLLLAGIRKSENTAVAMDSRAFGAFEQRTYLHRFEWSRSGVIFLIVFTVIGALAVWGSFVTSGHFYALQNGQ